MVKRLALPSVSSDGALLVSHGRSARAAVSMAFDMIGGVERLAEWADKNEGEFFTKLFPKIITRESDVNVAVGIEEKLASLESLDYEDVLDASFEVLDIDDADR